MSEVELEHEPSTTPPRAPRSGDVGADLARRPHRRRARAAAAGALDPVGRRARSCGSSSSAASRCSRPARCATSPPALDVRPDVAGTAAVRRRDVPRARTRPAGHADARLDRDQRRPQRRDARDAAGHAPDARRDRGRQAARRLGRRVRVPRREPAVPRARPGAGRHPRDGAVCVVVVVVAVILAAVCGIGLGFSALDHPHRRVDGADVPHGRRARPCSRSSSSGSRTRRSPRRSRSRCTRCRRLGRSGDRGVHGPDRRSGPSPHTERTWWLLGLNPFVVVADAAGTAEYDARSPNSNDPLGAIRDGVRELRAGTADPAPGVLDRRPSDDDPRTRLPRTRVAVGAGRQRAAGRRRVRRRGPPAPHPDAHARPRHAGRLTLGRSGDGHPDAGSARCPAPYGVPVSSTEGVAPATRRPTAAGVRSVAAAELRRRRRTSRWVRALALWCALLAGVLLVATALLRLLTPGTVSYSGPPAGGLILASGARPAALELPWLEVSAGPTLFAVLAFTILAGGVVVGAALAATASTDRPVVRPGRTGARRLPRVVAGGVRVRRRRGAVPRAQPGRGRGTGSVRGPRGARRRRPGRRGLRDRPRAGGPGPVCGQGRPVDRRHVRRGHPGDAGARRPHPAPGDDDRPGAGLHQARVVPDQHRQPDVRVRAGGAADHPHGAHLVVAGGQPGSSCWPTPPGRPTPDRTRAAR